MCANCHAERFCTGCHGVTVPGLPERLRFDDPRGAGMHRAGFKARHAEEAKADPGLCTTCHQPTACQQCHQREGVLGAAGQPQTSSPTSEGMARPARLAE